MRERCGRRRLRSNFRNHPMNKPVHPIKAMSEAQPQMPAANTQAQPPAAAQDAPLPSFETLDHVARALIARVTQGISPHVPAAAWFDWLSHLSRAPGRQLELAMQAFIFTGRLLGWANARDGVNAGLPFPPDIRRPALRRPDLAENALSVLRAGFPRAGAMVAKRDAPDPRAKRPQRRRALHLWPANCSMSCRRRTFLGSTR